MSQAALKKKKTTQLTGSRSSGRHALVKSSVPPWQTGRHGVLMGPAVLTESRGHRHVVLGWAPCDWPQSERTNGSTHQSRRRKEDPRPVFISMTAAPRALGAPGKFPPNEAHPQLLKLTPSYPRMWATYEASMVCPFVFGGCRHGLEGGHITGICSKIYSLGLIFRNLPHKQNTESNCLWEDIL